MKVWYIVWVDKSDFWVGIKTYSDYKVQEGRTYNHLRDSLRDWDQTDLSKNVLWN